jgi:hypothetical protein
VALVYRAPATNGSHGAPPAAGLGDACHPAAVWDRVQGHTAGLTMGCRGCMPLWWQEHVGFTRQSECRRMLLSTGACTGQPRGVTSVTAIQK